MDTESKRVHVLHAKLRDAYDAYCAKTRSANPRSSPNARLTKAGVNTSHLQRLFAARGEGFETPQKSTKISRKTLGDFIGVVAPGASADDFIDQAKKTLESAEKSRGADDAACATAANHTATADWTPGATVYPFGDGFVRLVILPQPAGRRFPLDVTGGLSTHFLKIPEGDGTPQLPANVRVKKAEILHLSQTLEPIDDTILGKKTESESENLTYDGVRWNIDNPREENFNPLDNARLCEMRAVRGGPHELELLLRCREIDLEIEFINPPPDVSATDLAIIRRMLQKLGAKDPDADYVELARARISSKGKK
jgi:hypothetical protein